MLGQWRFLSPFLAYFWVPSFILLELYLNCNFWILQTTSAFEGLHEENWHARTSALLPSFKFSPCIVSCSQLCEEALSVTHELEGITSPADD